MILSKQGITKALISLRGCAGWSAPLLFSNPIDRFYRVEAQLTNESAFLLQWFLLDLKDNLIQVSFDLFELMFKIVNNFSVMSGHLELSDLFLYVYLNI